MLYFDLDAIFEYCKLNNKTNTKPSSKNSDEFRQKEISDSYEQDEQGNLVLSQKVVHEVITPQEDTTYDEAKLDIVNKLLVKYLSEDTKLTDSASMQMATVLGTFQKYNFIKEIKEQ